MSTSTTQAKKKQTRGIETRARILEATKQLISDHDFYSVTLDQISQEADVAKSSLLWHFNSKEMLLTEAACELFADLEQAIVLVRKDEHSLDQRKEIFLAKVGEYFELNPEPKGVLISLMFNSELSQQIRERIESYWAHHIDAIQYYFSLPDKPFSPEASKAVLTAIHGCYLQWYLHQDERSFQDTLKDYFKYFSII